MKKILSFILIFALIISVSLSVTLVSAEEEEFPILSYGDVKYAVELGEVHIVGPSDQNLTNITIPGTIDEYPVTIVGGFRGNRTIESVTIEDGVREIAFEAFKGCSKLQSVIIPDSVRTIKRNAFAGTPVYADRANWDNNVLYLGNHLICTTTTGYKAFTEYTVREGTVSIAMFAFAGQDKLERIHFPDSLLTIGEWAFEECSSLTVADLPENLEYLGRSAFSQCALEEVVIPESLTSISDYVFSLNKVSSLKLHDKLISIGNCAFLNCDGLTEVTVPESVTVINGSAFRACDSLQVINLPDNLTSIGYGIVTDTAFFNNPDNWDGPCLYIGDYLVDGDSLHKGSVEIKEGTKLISDNTFYLGKDITCVTFPESLEIIGAQAFDSCENLADIKLPENLKEIKLHAFANCSSLKSVYIPESVETISVRAFYECKNLKTVTIADPLAEIEEEALGYYPVYDSCHDWVMYHATVDEFTIRGLNGSTAERYAEENGFDFEEIVISDITGDLDGDKVVTIKDATYIQKAVANIIPLLKAQKTCADADSDNSITIKDATWIQKQIAGLF